MSLGLGRTGYYVEDHALHRRELVMELTAEHGGAAGYVYRVLRDITQEQRQPDGSLLTGFRSLSVAAAVDAAKCRHYVETMAELGLLDEFEVLGDGRRFTCRMSGWRSDQRRGSDALRQAAKREKNAVDASRASVTVPHGGTREPEPSPNTKQSNTKNRESVPRVTYEGTPVPDLTLSGAFLLLEHFNETADRNLGAWKGTGRISDSLRQIVGALLSRPEVTVDEWRRAITNTIANPPDWVEGQVQLGHIFGPKAADHALSNNGKRRNGHEPTAEAMFPSRTTCIDCEEDLKPDEVGRCRGCRRAIDERNTGVAA